MPGNPFNEARQQRLKDDATEMLEKFTVNFLKSFGISIFLKIKNEMEEGGDSRQLKYRDWNTITRKELFSGECYMKTGAGPSSFGKWKKVFVVETQEYNLNVYKDDKTYQAGKKPSQTINMAGYSLERDVSRHYRWDMRYLASGLGLTETEVELMNTFSPYSWALTHPWRTNYIFQLHKGKDAACGCLGGNQIEPQEAGAELANDRSKYIEAFDRCVSKSCPRDCSTVIGMAFDRTCTKMTEQTWNLRWWSDNGSEAEMLTDMLMEQCMPELRDGMLEDLTGPVSIRISLWYNIRNMMMGVLSPMVKAAWAAMQKGAEAVQGKVEPVVRAGVEPILKAKEEVKNKIRAAVISKMGEFLQKNVSPFLKPVFDVLDKPMAKGFQSSRDAYEKNVQIATLPGNADQRNDVLDAIPRTWSIVCDASNASYDLVEPLRALKSLSADIFGEIDVYGLRSQAEDALLTTLDGAVYTLELRMDECGQDESLKAEILADFDHDVALAKAAFAKELIRSLLIGNFKRAVSPVTDPIISTMDDAIPSDLQDIISAQGIFDEVVDLFVGEPIDSMVDGAYPPPKAAPKAAPAAAAPAKTGSTVEME